MSTEERAQHLAQLVQQHEASASPRLLARRAHWPFDMVCDTVVSALRSVRLNPYPGITATMLAETQALDEGRVHEALLFLEAEGVVQCLDGDRWRLAS